jgi:hypothetical protein
LVNIQINVRVPGYSLLFSLYPALILDDYKRVKSIIAKALKNLPSTQLTFVEDLLIIDPDLRVYAFALLENGQRLMPIARVSN